MHDLAAGQAMERTVVMFEDIWNQMHGRLCWFVCSRVSNTEDAQDLLQDIFVRIYQQRQTIRDTDRLKSWMYQIALIRIFDLYRGRRQWIDLPETLTIDALPDSKVTEELV